MIRIAIGGANGRVGKLLASRVENDSNLVLAAKAVKDLENKSTLHAASVPIDVLIDFSVPEAVMEHLEIALTRHFGMVIGVTGLTPAQENKIKIASKQIPILFAPNMSLGININYKLIEIAAKTFKNADVAIVDIHHRDKKDTPSGTAIKIAEIINGIQGKSFEESTIHFSSLRLGDTPAEVRVIFARPGERIEINHQATDRAVFSEGALEAAKWLVNQKSGLYTMQDMLSL